MFEDIPKDLFDKLDPARLHAALVHIPIALALLGFILVLGVAITGSKSPGLRWTTVFVFMLATLAALWTVQSGENAEHALRVAPTGDAHIALEKHENLAKPFWISMAVTGGLVLFSTLRVTWFRTICLVLSILTSAASVVWVGAIGHWGGEMVYAHQIGTGPNALKSPGDTPEKTDPNKDAAPKDAPAKDADVKDAAAKDAPAKDSQEKAKDAEKDAVKDKGEERPELKNPPEVKDKSKLFP